MSTTKKVVRHNEETEHHGVIVRHDEGQQVVGRFGQGPKIIGEFPKYVDGKLIKSADELPKKRGPKPKVEDASDTGDQ